MFDGCIKDVAQSKGKCSMVALTTHPLSKGKCSMVALMTCRKVK